MDFHIRIEGSRDLARQVYRQIRAAILDGTIKGDERLPPTRELAARLDLSRNTISLAYEWLAAEGLLSGRSGAGSFVQGPPPSQRRRTSRTPLLPVASWNGIAAPAGTGPPPRYNFGVGMPDAGLFPFDSWRRLLTRQIRASRLTSDYGDPAGHPALRAAVARYVGISRGVIAGPDDVLITNGAQGAFDLIARVLLEPGVRVAVEEPGYPPPGLLFQSLGARVSAVPVDAEGLDISALPDDTRLVYVTPSHQFPLGLPMSQSRRMALLAWAGRRNAVVIEDDYDSEFRFGGRPLETLQAVDRGGRVIYVGSFSKTMLPALRLGFLIAPQALQPALRAASYVSGWFSQWPAQAALASFIEGGLLARHTRKMRREYSARHQLILAALNAGFGRWLDPIPSVTGMHLSARLRSGGIRLERQIVLRAADSGIVFDRLSAFCRSDSPQTGLALGYGGIATSDIEEAMRKLRRCFPSG